MSHFDPRINHCELEVQRIIHLKNLENKLPYAFIDTKKMTKSYILSVNAPTQIDVPERQLANESKICLKLGRPIGSKDITPGNRRTHKKISASREANIEQKAPIEAYGEQRPQ